MNNRTRIGNKGFSLLELLICLAISSFVILAAYSLVLVGTRSYESNNKSTSLQKEASFTMNLLGDTIRNGRCEDTSISYINSFKDIEIHTGSRVICYDESEKSLYIYKEAAGATYWPTTPSKENLISKYVKSFKAEFVSGQSSYEEVETVVSATTKTVKATEAVTDGTNLNSTDMIKFTITFEVSGKVDTTEVIYQIRN